MRLAKRTLVSFGNHTCNFAIMFWCICYINDFSCDYKSSVFVLWVEKAGYTASSKRQESGCKGLVCASDCSRCAVEPLRVEPPVADFKPVRVMDGYCLQQEAGGRCWFCWHAPARDHLSTAPFPSTNCPKPSSAWPKGRWARSCCKSEPRAEQFGNESPAFFAVLRGRACFQPEGRKRIAHPFQRWADSRAGRKQQVPPGTAEGCCDNEMILSPLTGLVRVGKLPVHPLIRVG